MKVFLTLLSSFLISCSSTKSSRDLVILDGLIAVHQSGDLKTLILNFGRPTVIEKTETPDISKYIYENALGTNDSFESRVNSKGEVITSMAYFFKTPDDYKLLKDSFGNYEWIEKSNPSNLSEVEIPEIGISFQYDRQAPKVMWIYFSKPLKL